jgi:hypothetical protein
MPCTRQKPPGTLPHVPHVYIRSPFRLYLIIFDEARRTLDVALYLFYLDEPKTQDYDSFIAVWEDSECDIDSNIVCLY